MPARRRWVRGNLSRTASDEAKPRVRPNERTRVGADVAVPIWRVDISGTDLPPPSSYSWNAGGERGEILRIEPASVMDERSAPGTIRVRAAREQRDLARLVIESTAERPVIALITPEARCDAAINPSDTCVFLRLSDADPSRVGGLVLRLAARGEAWRRHRAVDSEATALAMELVRPRVERTPRSGRTASIKELRLRHILEVRGGPWRREVAELHLEISRSSMHVWAPAYVGYQDVDADAGRRLRVGWKGKAPPVSSDGLEFLRVDEGGPWPTSDVDAVVCKPESLDEVMALEQVLCRATRGPTLMPILILTSEEHAPRFTPYVPLGVDVLATSGSASALEQTMALVTRRLPGLVRLARLEDECACLWEQATLRLPPELGRSDVSCRALESAASRLARGLVGDSSAAARMLGVCERTFAGYEARATAGVTSQSQVRERHA